MPILVLPKLFPPYYLRLTVITSIELGILFSAADPEVQRGKLTCLKSPARLVMARKRFELSSDPRPLLLTTRSLQVCISSPFIGFMPCISVVMDRTQGGDHLIEESLVLKISDPKEFNVPPPTEHEGGNILCPNDKIQWKSWLSPLSETDWLYPALLWVV